MLRSLLPIVLTFTACSSSPPAPPPDAPGEIDAGAGPTDATDGPADAQTQFAPCSEVCPGEELTPWYNPANTYVWSYCRPSYQRCDDPTAPRCGGCPPP